MTENFVVLVEFPLILNGAFDLLLSGKPFIHNYRWHPERGTRFLVIDKRDGQIAAEAYGESFFAFHHVNAFERGDDLFIDICTYPDASLIDDLYLHRVREYYRNRGALRRFHLNLNHRNVRETVIYDVPFDLPRIHYRKHNGAPYRYAYGVGNHAETMGDFINQLVKVDVETGEAHHWYTAGCYPGEPVFVAAPDAKTEDDGVILSVVLDASRGASFLLVLDAHTFEECARAEVPQAIPFGFHGQFFS